MEIREAQTRDAEAMSEVLNELIAAGQRVKPGDVTFVLSHYIQHPDRLHCGIACDGHGKVLGFQSLKIANEGNPYQTPIGWGIIGTHVRPSAARLGVASQLFASTLKAARKAKLTAIEAYIGDQNEAALAYYERMGFRTYRLTKGVICKALKLLNE